MGCPHFPCSLYITNCKYCYCPFYPCRDERTGGRYVLTKNGYELWDCTACRYIHNDCIVKLINLDINERDSHKLKIAWNRIERILNGSNPIL